jgi:hypothetical protein
MTFLEAAIEVLRSSEEPLHYIEIARLAVERKLLSHVGRDPEAAMQSCLNSAVRSKVHDGLVMRSKPGHYRLRPGAELPELPPSPSAREREPLPDVHDEDFGDRKKSRDIKPKAAAPSTVLQPPVVLEAEPEEADASEDEAPQESDEDDDELESDEATPAESSSRAPIQTSFPMPHLDPSKVRFRGPQGSGLEGETDVALVMANAMSRLVDERPELREELEAMQKGQAPVPEVIEVGRKKRLDEDRLRERDRDRDRDDDRGGRRRRRRRRRGRRVDWAEGGGNGRTAATRGIELLDKVAAVLAEAGSRSLHVRQIAENLASQNVLGGEISEIERAVTAAILLDVHRRRDASRFAVRGDARYQLRGSRLPEKAALAERAARAALLALESETEAQLLLWLQSLGARSLEALVRIWLEREDYSLVATLPPSRGLGKLVADEPELEDEDGRTLVLIVPRKTALEPKLWEGEAERNGCSGTLVFTMSDPPGDPALQGDARVISAKDFTRWLLRNGIGVQTLEIKVPVLDANLIESIAGLDT